jgi:adenine specific DNA methylase Mod
MTQNLKLTNNESEIRKDIEEQTAWRNNQALLNMDQNIELLIEKMSDFELKLNYALLRQTKFTKKKNSQQQITTTKSSNQQEVYQNKLVNSKIKIRASFFIYLPLILIVIYIFLSKLSELILVNNGLD